MRRWMIRVALLMVMGLALMLPRAARVHGYSNPEDNEAEPILRSSINLVTIYASVSDHSGHFVDGLKPDDFEIYDNGTRQQIEFFSKEERPLSVGIVFDISASMKERMDRSTEAVRHFLDMQCKDDEFFLLTFNTAVYLSRDYTTSTKDIVDSLLDVAPNGLTALNDAVFAGIEKVKQGHHQKHALILISDGQDNSSWYTSKEVGELLREADVELFSIGISDEKVASLSLLDREGQGVLKQFSEMSGGRAFFPRNMDELDQMLTKIGVELRSQYSLGFTPSTGLDGRWHKLQVRLKDEARTRLAVRSRAGY